MNIFTKRDASAAARAISSVLEREHNLTRGHEKCLELVAIAHGFQDWNVMSAKLAKGDPTVLTTNMSALQEGRNWPALTGPGLHIIACADGSLLPEIVKQFIVDLVCSVQARELVERGCFWRLNYYYPEGLDVGDIYPAPQDGKIDYHVAERATYPSSETEDTPPPFDQIPPLDIDAKDFALFRTRIFRDIDADLDFHLAERCLTEARNVPVILLLAASTPEQALGKLACEGWRYQDLVNPLLIRRIEVVAKTPQGIRISDAVEGSYSTLARLLEGQNIELTEKPGRVFTLS